MKHLVFVLALGSAVLGATQDAEARFGKAGGSRGGGSGGGGGGGGGGSRGSSGSSGGGYVRPAYPAYPVYPYYHAPWFAGSYYYYPYVGPDPMYQPYYPSAAVSKDKEPLHVMMNLGGEAQVRAGGGSLGAGMMLEGERIGFTSQFTALFQRADDGSNTTDTIKLWGTHLTFAVIANEHGRLRLEGGVNAAFAPDMNAVGLSGGLSTVWALAGPLGFEGAVHYTPWPFIDVDWSAGLALNVSPALFRFGIRQMILDDRGGVDGVSHRDVFTGPYLGLSFFL